MIVTLSGASGAGKSTIGEWLRQRFGVSLKPVVSYTTREPRDADPSGEYAYVSSEEFERMKANKEFLWSVFVHGIHFGTTLRSFEETKREPDAIFLMILEPDSVGTLHIHAKRMGLKIVPFYILPPSISELRRRLEKRGDTAGVIEKRIDDCLKWDAQALTSGIPYTFVRNDLDDTGRLAATIITREISERMVP